MTIKNSNHIKLLQTVLDESGYSAMLKNKKDVDNENRLENIKELLSAMKEFDNLESFLEHVSLATSIDQEWDGEKINMMTMHAAKGLEFDVVFLPGWEEGLFPHQKSIEEKGQNGLEEERRLAYVGITRAKKKAIISFSMNRFYQGDWIDSMASRFIEELPDAWGTMVGEGGHRLSGGQRQRLAIARAVLKDAPVLILDEATSAVDNETEAALQRSISKISRDRTAIIIAHRLSTIRNAHRIVVLENGVIIEDGAHEDLVSKRGTYARMWAVQTGSNL